MKIAHGFYFPEYDTHFPRLLEKSIRKDGVNRYQYKARDFAVSLCKNKRVALDIGANVGLWSCDLVKDFNHVHAFEPVKEFRNCFLKNVSTENFTMHECALGDKESFIEMIITKDNTGHSHVDPESFGKGSVPLKTLDSFNFAHVDLIKIDCEGFETPILAGAKETILNNKPILIIEQQKHEYLDQTTETPDVRLLESWGYQVVEKFNKDWILKFANDLS
jgi:FkbM family methyltransferase